VTGAVAAGFVLGLYVHSGVSLTTIASREALHDLSRLVPAWLADFGMSLAFDQGLRAGSDRSGGGAGGVGLALEGGTPAPPVQDHKTRTPPGIPMTGPAAPMTSASDPSSGASLERPAAATDSATVDQPATAGNDATPWDVLYARAHKLQSEGDLVAATAAYRQAARLDPQQAAVLYDLGYVLQLQGKDDAAIEYYRRAIAQQPKHAFAHYNLGTLLQKKGDFKAAIAHYKIAAAFEAGDPYIYYDWARSLEAIGDTMSAATMYRKVIALEPDRRPGLDARQRLAALAAPTANQARP
jgi:tetratricopeptide (TPR) repeat protein